MIKNKLAIWFSDRAHLLIASLVFILWGLDVYFSGGSYIRGSHVQPETGIAFFAIGMLLLLYVMLKKTSIIFFPNLNSV